MMSLKFRIGSLVRFTYNRKLMIITSVVIGKGRIRYYGTLASGKSASAWESQLHQSKEK